MFRLPLPLFRPRRSLPDPAAAIAGAVLALACAAPLAADTTDLGEPDLIEQVPLRDGARLHTQVHLPPGDGPFPAILVRTPYGVPTQISGPVALDEEAEEDPAALLATWAPVFERGYAVVFQNTRGRGLSGGIDKLFTTEREDGADTAAWLTAQPWSDGTFVLTGDSADGFAGLLTAAARPEGLRGGFFQASCGNLMREGVVRRTGGLQMESLAPWVYAQVGDSGPENLEMLAGLGVDPEAVEEEAGALFGTL
ncbi:MAG: CocE/NonD family hydrolase, partial [Rhodobacter sp.]|nr:CocE/NonD family hydrolase [Rhodobacter sp.]